MCISQAISILKLQFKTHSSVARFLGLTPEHYRAIRNGRVHIPKRTADLIILKAQEAAIFTPAQEKTEA